MSGMRDERRPSGFTLAEVTAAMVLTALLAVVASRPFPRGSLDALDAESAAFELSLTLRSLRQQAILTGTEHGVRLTRRSGRITRMQLYQVSGGTRVALTSRPSIDLTAVRMTSPLRQFSFQADGSSTAGTIDVQSSHRSWRVETLSLTGAVRVFEQ